MDALEDCLVLRILKPVFVLVICEWNAHISTFFSYQHPISIRIFFYALFWVIPRRLNFLCRRFETLCSIFIDMYLRVEWSRLGTEQSVPKRRHIKFRRRGATQKKAYNIQEKAKVWNQEEFSSSSSSSSPSSSSYSSDITVLHVFWFSALDHSRLSLLWRFFRVSEYLGAFALLRKVALGFVMF